MPNLAAKRQCFIIRPGKNCQPRDIEFVDPKAQEKSHLDSGGTINRTNLYESMSLLYRDAASAVKDEVRKEDDTRGYHESVFRYASDADGDIEVPKKKKADAKYVLRVMQSLDSGYYLDTKNGLSFEEVPDEEVIPKASK